VAQTGTKPQTEAAPQLPMEELVAPEVAVADVREGAVARLRLLWNARSFLGKTTFLGLALGVLSGFLIPKRYEATAQLMPPNGQSGTGMAMLAALSARTGSALSGSAGDLLGVKSSGALFVGILQSRTVADRLIGQFQLQSVYQASTIEDARMALASHSNVAEDRKSGIISVTVSDHDPQRAARMAQGYIGELDRLVADVSTSSAHRERVFLEERLHDVKRDLDASARKFSEFASTNAAIDIPAQGKAMVEAAATLQGQLIAAESEMRGLEQIYTSQNVRVRSLRARVGELRQHLEKLGGADAGPDAKGDRSLYPSIRKLPLLGVTYADLHRQTKIQETVYELLTQQYELAKVEEAKEIPAVKVLDAAVAPTKKTFPPRMLIMFIGMMLAFTGAVMWVLGKARWDEMNQKDPGKVLAREVFATLRAGVPRFSKNGTKARETGDEMPHWVRERRDDQSEAE
jgi:uncharacterized protein involved in exopolysaccharide biosynthesis